MLSDNTLNDLSALRLSVSDCSSMSITSNYPKIPADVGQRHVPSFAGVQRLPHGHIVNRGIIRLAFLLSCSVLPVATLGEIDGREFDSPALAVHATRICFSELEPTQPPARLYCA
jgi:hypothetical protein